MVYRTQLAVRATEAGARLCRGSDTTDFTKQSLLCAENLITDFDMRKEQVNHAHEVEKMTGFSSLYRAGGCV